VSQNEPVERSRRTLLAAVLTLVGGLATGGLARAMSGTLPEVTVHKDPT
jgi:hypothetical protein